MPVWLKERALMATSPLLHVSGLDVVRDPKRLRRNRQAWVDRRRRRKERRVHDEEILDVVRATERIEHRLTGVGAEAERPALMRRVLALMRVLHDDPEAE